MPNCDGLSEESPEDNGSLTPKKEHDNTKALSEPSRCLTLTGSQLFLQDTHTQLHSRLAHISAHGPFQARRDPVKAMLAHAVRKPAMAGKSYSFWGFNMFNKIGFG